MTQSLTNIIISKVNDIVEKTPKKLIVVNHNFNSTLFDQKDEDTDHIIAHVYCIKDQRFQIEIIKNANFMVCKCETPSFETVIVRYDYSFNRDGKIYKMICTAYDMAGNINKMSLDPDHWFTYNKKHLIINGSYYDLSVSEELHIPTGETPCEMCKSNM